MVAGAEVDPRLLLIVVLVAAIDSGVAVNVALNKPVEAKYTCGEFGPESFFTLSDAVIHTSDRERKNCTSTLSNSSLPAAKPSYPPSAMVDGNLETWWQSVSLFKTYFHGKDLEAEMIKELQAVITLDLLQEFLVERIILQLGNALTPGKVQISKSLDGITFTPWIYAVANLDDCSEFFQTIASSLPTADLQTICVGYVADHVPPGDKIEVDIAGVPLTLKEWVRARHLEFKFYDMQFIAPFNKYADRFNHYSVLEVTVMAECPCNGQQDDCLPNPTTGIYECVCGGNTRGRFCELCQPKFNQFPFRFGEDCEECNCFNHSSSCIYQASLEETQASLDIAGVRRGGGACLDCQHNTAGVNCEKCKRLYYRPDGRQQTAQDACIACACSTSGSTVNPKSGIEDCLMSSDEVSTDGKLPGDCYCKENVQGSKCDTCKQGFYNLKSSNAKGCSACSCFTAGTVAASELCLPDSTGQCTCKTNVNGRACDTCKDNFYALDKNSTDGCQPCNCDIGGSMDQLCDKLTGQCRCRNGNILGRSCDKIRSGFHHPSLYAVFEELEDSFGLISWKNDPLYSGFTGRGYAELAQGEEISVLVNIAEGTKFSQQYILILRYRTRPNSPGPRSVTIQAQSTESLASVDVDLPDCPTTWCQVNTLSDETRFAFSPGSNLISLTLTAGDALLDKLVAFPVEYLSVEDVLPNALPTGCNLLDNTVPSDPTDAETCANAIFSLTMYYWGAPSPCDCDVTGSASAECDAAGGQCECRNGVIGRTCDKCSPAHYGFSSTGCTGCGCDSISTTCDSVTGQCLCPDNTVGRQCEVCLPNHWGWNGTQGCQACDCSPDGSLSLQCDATSGACSCRIGADGNKCNECLDGFYRIDGQGCVPCNCSMAGSQTQVCNKTNGQCTCKKNTEGRLCDSCLVGTFGLDASNAFGCLECVCMGITSLCQSATINLSTDSFQLIFRDESNQDVPNLSLVQEDGSSAEVAIRVEQRDDLTSALTVDVGSGQPPLYWRMPEEFTSNVLNLYKTNVDFTSNYVIVEGEPIVGLKAVIKSSDGTIFTHAIANFEQGQDTLLGFSLEESDWQMANLETNPTRSAFLKVLATVEFILIPASFSSETHTARLSKLSFSSENALGVASNSVEKCVCGTEYYGNSCEKCATSYKRANVSSSDFLGVCVPCQCNGLAETCNPDTGVCQECQNNTSGDSCEACTFGFYREATEQVGLGCSACPCYVPRVLNATCHLEAPLTNNGSLIATGQTAIKCDFCQSGYTGNLCDECAPSFYGDPKADGGSCSPCECNGNSDTCDKLTGVCESCSSSTTGDKCETCITDFYGNASLQECKDCNCQPLTSNSSACDSVTGLCPCVYGVEGRSCDYCQQGYWGFNSADFTGCKSCGCVVAGSVSVQCDNETAQCSCRPNTSGVQCDTCANNFYGLPTSPCQECNCSSVGSQDGTVCNTTSGQCQCKPGVGGRQCDKCLPFFTGFGEAGCQECGECHTSLGDNINTLSDDAATLLETSSQVLAIQMQDQRLVVLTGQLTDSLNSLGLGGGDINSATDFVQNVTAVQQTLSAQVTQTNAQLSSLNTSMISTKTRAAEQSERHSSDAEQSVNLVTNVNSFERVLGSYIQYMTVYNTTASQFLGASNDSQELTLSLESELKNVNDLLSKLENNTNRNATDAAVEQQALDVASVNASIYTLSVDADNKAASITDTALSLNAASYTSSTVDYHLSQGLLYKAQADDLLEAVNDIQVNTEEKNKELNSALTNARISARNTDAVYSGNAVSLLNGEDALPFPNGVTNFLLGKERLTELLSSVPTLLERVRTEIAQTEINVANMEAAVKLLNSSYLSISSVGTDAVKAISNYREVVTDLESAEASAKEADELIKNIRNSISGDALEALRTEYLTEQNVSGALSQTMLEIDYQPQVLQSRLDAANAEIKTRELAWDNLDELLDSVTTTAQALSDQAQGKTLQTQMASAQSQVESSIATSASVLETANRQDITLDQKAMELDVMEEQTNRVQELDLTVRERLTEYRAQVDVFQTNLTYATSLREFASDTSRTISDKIKLLESKLDSAETLLSQLRQPLRFDGSIGLELQNPVKDTPHTYDDLVVDVKKANNFTDGVIFFTESSTSVHELELGVADNRFFFEFNLGTELVRVDNPAEICDDCWARLFVSRFTSTGHLTVTLLSTGTIVSKSAVAQNPAQTATFNSNLYVGNIPEEVASTKVVNKEFQGCLMNLQYQGEYFSLVAAAVLSNQPSGCCQPPPEQSSLPVVSGVSFSGFSHLVLDPSTSTGFNEITRLSLELRTFMTDSPVASISSSDDQTRFSLSFVSGFVVWEILTGGTPYRATSQNTYAHAQWITIIMEIGLAQLTLNVSAIEGGDGSADVVTLDRDVLDLAPLTDQNVVFGSASDPLSEDYKAENTNFAGCIRNVVISFTSTTEVLNMNENVVSSSRVLANGCYENIVPGFTFETSTSFLTWSAPDQTQALSTFQVDFLTDERQGILLYISALDSVRFLYLAVFGGNIVLMYRENSTNSLISFDHFVSDGQLHSVKVDCSTKRVSMFIDDMAFEEESETLNSTFLTFPASATVYVGGVKETVTLQPDLPMRKSLAGGINRLILNSQQLSPGNIEDYQDISLAGIPIRAGIISPSANLACLLPPEPILRALSDGIVLTGTQPIIWSDIVTDETIVHYFEGSFLLNIKFRTYKADGVLLYVANSLANPTNYVSLYLLDGFVNLRMRTSDGEDRHSNLVNKYNDGGLYELSVIRINSFTALNIEAKKDYMNNGATPENATELVIPESMDVYLGGIGINDRLFSAVPPEMQSSPEKIRFAGEFHSFILQLGENQQELNFSLLDRVDFPAVPENVRYGTSLSGVNSYLRLDPLTVDPNNFTIEIVLTTTSSSALLLLLFEQTAQNFIAVDIQNFKLRLHISPSFPGVTDPMTLDLLTTDNLCDGKNHFLRLTFLDRKLELSLDGTEASVTTIPMSHAIQQTENMEFFIGGLSDQSLTFTDQLVKSSLKGCIQSVELRDGDKLTDIDPTSFHSASAGVSYSCPF